MVVDASIDDDSMVERSREDDDDDDDEDDDDDDDDNSVRWNAKASAEEERANRATRMEAI